MTLPDNIKQSALALLQKKKRPVPAITPPANFEQLVTVVRPASGVTAEELLRVAAATQRRAQESFAKAITQKAETLKLSIPEPEDFRYLPSGGIHCWVDDIPTLAGSRTFLEALGIAVPVSEEVSSALFVAQGKRCLGYIQLA